MSGSTLFPELFAGLLGEAFERFLKLDPHSPTYLAPLSGKVINIHLTPFDLQLFICPGENSMEILPSFEGKPDVTLSGSPLAFARMGLSANPRRALFSGDVIIEGDMTTARRFQSLFERLDIDWESLLARFAGPGIAARLIGDWRSTYDWGRDTLDTWEMNLAEYWQEESRELPAEAEAGVFYEDVDTLRADYDRLEARVLRLEGRIFDSIENSKCTK
jgi:ubiquinone biosynthesis protein UbiJ